MTGQRCQQRQQHRRRGRIERTQYIQKDGQLIPDPEQMVPNPCDDGTKAPRTKRKYIMHSFEQMVEVFESFRPHDGRSRRMPHMPEEYAVADPQFGVVGAYVSIKKHRSKYFRPKMPKLLIPIYLPFYLKWRVKGFVTKLNPWDTREHFLIKVFRRFGGPKIRQELAKALGKEYYDHIPEWIQQARLTIMNELVLPFVYDYIDARMEYFRKKGKMEYFAGRFNPEDVREVAKMVITWILTEYFARTTKIIPLGALADLLPKLYPDLFKNCKEDRERTLLIGQAMKALKNIGLVHLIEGAKGGRYKLNAMELSPATMMLIFVVLDWFGYAFKADAYVLDKVLRASGAVNMILTSIEYWCCANFEPKEKLHPWVVLRYLGARRDVVETIVEELEKKLPPPPQQEDIKDLMPVIENIMRRVGIRSPSLAKFAYVISLAELMGLTEKLMQIFEFKRMYLRFKEVMGPFWNYFMAHIEIAKAKLASRLFTKVSNMAQRVVKQATGAVARAVNAVSSPSLSRGTVPASVPSLSSPPSPQPPSAPAPSPPPPQPSFSIEEFSTSRELNSVARGIDGKMSSKEENRSILRRVFKRLKTRKRDG